MSGYQTQYLRYARLQEILADARKHCDTATNRRNLNRNKVHIIDDFGTSSISDDLASDLLTVLEEPLDAKISFRDKSLYWSHGKCDTLKNSKTTLFPAF